MLRGNINQNTITRSRLIHHRRMNPRRLPLLQQRNKILLMGKNLHLQILLRKLFKRYIKLIRRLLTSPNLIPRDTSIIQKFAKFFISLSPILHRVRFNPSHLRSISHSHPRPQSLKEIILPMGTQFPSMVRIPSPSRHIQNHQYNII